MAKKIGLIEFLDRAGEKEFELGFGERWAVAVAESGGTWPNIKTFSPIGFEADSWEDVLAFVERRPIVRVDRLRFDNASGNMHRYNTYWSVYVLGERNPDPRIDLQMVYLSEYRASRQGSVAMGIASKIRGEGCPYLRQEFEVPVSLTFEGTGKGMYSALESRWSEEALVEVSSEVVTTLSIHDGWAWVGIQVEVVVTDTRLNTTLWRCTISPADKVAKLFRKEAYVPFPPCILEYENLVKKLEVHGLNRVPPVGTMTQAEFKARRLEYRRQGLPRGVAKRRALKDRAWVDPESDEMRYFSMPDEELLAEQQRLNRLLRDLEAYYRERQHQTVLDAAVAWEEDLAAFIEEWRSKVDHVIDKRKVD